ncbi:hypothetical protein HZB01_01670 [Candidatus Woesearchaeota archaeon]|nr:hypothetical protein [Candidatus Woesearchaeota archaeon]
MLGNLVLLQHAKASGSRTEGFRHMEKEGITNKELEKLFAEARTVKPKRHLTAEQMHELNELEFGILFEKAKQYKHNLSPEDLKKIEEEQYIQGWAVQLQHKARAGRFEQLKKQSKS